MDNVIKVDNLVKTYDNKQAVNNISFTVEKGSVFGLLGANGAGKSTTIECILGTKNYDSGHVSVLGMNPIIMRKSLFERVGVQFQEAKYQENIKVKELCEVTASLYKNTLDYKELLSQFRIQDKMESLVKELSGGERQRLFVILALIPNPELVFLDELTTGLDSRARRDVWKILSGLKEKGLSILLTSHFMDEVEVLCDKICILKKGEIVFLGKVEEAIEKSPYDTLEKAYLWYSDEEENNNESI